MKTNGSWGALETIKFISISLSFSKRFEICYNILYKKLIQIKKNIQKDLFVCYLKIKNVSVYNAINKPRL